MASDLFVTATRIPLTRSAVHVLCCCLLALPCAGLAQRGETLGDLVFDVVPLATVRGLPIDFGGRTQRQTRALLDEIERLDTAVEPLEREGSTSPELIELLAERGLAYQRLDRHMEAIATFDAAIGLTIDNGGPQNLEQIPLLEQKIPSYLALDDYSAIDDTEEFIYALKADNYAAASRQMYYATINLADWNTAAYFLENYRAENGRGFGRLLSVLPRPSRSITVPGSQSEFETNDDARLADTGGLAAILNGEIRGVTKPDLIDPRLRRVDRLYVDYQNALAATGRGELDIAVDIAKRIARLAHLTKQEMDYERDNFSYDPDYEGSIAQALRTSAERMDESYDTGRRALEYMVSLLRSAQGMPPEALAAALLDVGDWHLAYGQVQGALDAYAEARQTLLTAGFTSANIDRAFESPLPRRIPLFATHLYSRESAGMGQAANLVYKGYVDVAFTVDQIGNGVDLEFLGNSGEDTQRIERLIETQFRSIKFRPELVGGEPQRSGRFEVRYNYSF